jgi:NitT/TauT family transport system ATP-binding protein
VVGPSGCGKFTLLRLLARLQSPSPGEVSVRQIGEGRHLVAPAFQEYSVFPWRTVETNVQLGLDAAGAGGRTEATPQARAWIDRLACPASNRQYQATCRAG